MSLRFLPCRKIQSMETRHKSRLHLRAMPHRHTIN